MLGPWRSPGDLWEALMKLKKLIKIINKENAPPDGWRPEDKVPSPKHQASSPKLRKHQAASLKPQAASIKLQAASDKLHNISAFIKSHVSRGEVLRKDKCIVRVLHMEGYLVWRKCYTITLRYF